MIAHNDLEISLPLGETDSHTFQLAVQAQTTEMIGAGRFELRDFPSLFELSVQPLLDEQTALMQGAQYIELDLAVSGEAAGPLEKLKRRVRAALHRIALFYVNKLAQRQYEIDRQQWLVLTVLARQVRETERLQPQSIEPLQTEIAQLQAARSSSGTASSAQAGDP